MEKLQAMKINCETTWSWIDKILKNFSLNSKNRALIHLIKCCLALINSVNMEGMVTQIIKV